MASYIAVPRDLTKVKSKIMFNLTKRQLICFSLEKDRQHQYGGNGHDGDHDADVLFCNV